MNSKIIVDLSIVENNIKRIVNNCKNISFIYPVKCINNKNVIHKIINKNVNISEIFFGMGSVGGAGV